MITYLASLTAWDWACILTAWVLLAIVAGVSLGRSMKHADDTQLAVYPPPVPHPAPTQADIDATWLDPWPTEPIRMPQQQVDRKCREIFAIEGLSS